MKYGRSLQELAIELDRQAKVKKDYVATAGAMQMTAVNENFDLVIGNTPFQLNENAHRQLGLQLKIPAPYYERMRAENPGLLMANVNGWFQQSPDTRRMVRTLDGTARAILSDRYRRIDNYEVAQTVLPIISEMQGARIESCELTDTRMYIKVVNERIQTEVVPGDIVQAGILISNSEVGMGSVSVKPLIYRLVCTNGMVADVGVGKRHVGRINESVDGDFGIFRDETIEADDRAFLMKIEDTVRAAVDEARFNALVQKLRDAKEAPILPAAAPKVVELAAKEFNIRQNESEGILGHLIAGGDLSLYGLANAVTRHAQDVQSYGGLDSDIAQIIYKELGAGIQTTGQKVVEVITASGATKAIHFNRPHPVPVYVKVVGLSTSGDFPHDGVDQLRAAIVAYIGDNESGGVSIGETLYHQRLPAVLYKVPGVLDFDVLIGTDAENLQADNIPVDSRSKVVTDDGMVTIDA